MTNNDPLSKYRFEIPLDSGRKIELTELRQSRTYSGLVCGYPNHQSRLGSTTAGPALIQ